MVRAARVYRDNMLQYWLVEITPDSDKPQTALKASEAGAALYEQTAGKKWSRSLGDGGDGGAAAARRICAAEWAGTR